MYFKLKDMIDYYSKERPFSVNVERDKCLLSNRLVNDFFGEPPE